ncbi:MAG: SLC13 family permease [Desulfobulbus sp.]|jgi:sodium-dependent dicarboxylate transporter 2/3/5
MAHPTSSQPVIAQAPPEVDEETKSTWRGLIIVLVAAILAWLVYAFLPCELEPRKGLALLVFVGILWLTEALHVTITALMVPVLALLFGIGGMTTTSAFANFADPIIFLFFGGFALATALNAQHLDRKMALGLVAAAGGRMGLATFYLFAATAGLSMWISNTATAAMMLPLALGLLAQMETDHKGTKIYVLLGIAYSASLGGLGTLVGSPPNGIAARALNMDFAGWMKVGVPVMLVTWPMMIGTLYWLFRPQFGKRVAGISVTIPWTFPRVLTLVLFTCTALAWIFSSKIGTVLPIKSLDSWIAVVAAILIAVFGLATWKQISTNTEWGVLFLFGGGLTLSSVMKTSGASVVLGQAVASVVGSLSPYFVALMVATFIIFLTEFTSNTASAALLVPVFAAIAEQMGMPPQMLVLLIGIGASMAFMLPVATPPNAIVFGTGHVPQRTMVKAGFVLNILCSLFLGTYGYFFFR